jgi:hypothetical protein
MAGRFSLSHVKMIHACLQLAAQSDHQKNIPAIACPQTHGQHPPALQLNAHQSERFMHHPPPTHTLHYLIVCLHITKTCIVHTLSAPVSAVSMYA